MSRHALVDYISLYIRYVQEKEDNFTNGQDKSMQNEVWFDFSFNINRAENNHLLCNWKYNCTADLFDW